MAEYIEREDVYNTLKAMYCDECTDEKCQMCEYAKIIFVLDNLPIADVQPVKRGRWIAENRDSRGYADCYTCSQCESYVYSYTLMRVCEFDYCPNCGAKMNDTEPIKG